MCHLKQPLPQSGFVPPNIPFKNNLDGLSASKKSTPATDSLALFSSNALSKRKQNPCSLIGSPPKKIRSPEERQNFIFQCDSPSSSKKEHSLIDATRSGNLDAIQSLLNSDHCDVNQTDPLGNTALHFAVFSNQVSIILKLLSSAEINIDSLNRLGMTPLLSAVEYGHSALVRILVSKGADLSIPDSQGFTVLHKAVLTGNMEILRFLLNQPFVPLDIASNEQQLTPLHQAAFHGKTKAIKLLLKANCQVSPLSSHRTTPLHMAALKNHTKAVSLLLASGSSADAQDNHNRTPLHYACMYGHIDTATVLCKGGCSIRLEDFKHQSPLQLSARAGFEGLLPILLSHIES
mmetsp:Transcript_12357/g.26311  ORF Transcript_12357/g.26311 Transcript_12357/m.26311 type:complete len:348 (-) Transcript_12357:94-1137(-)